MLVAAVQVAMAVTQVKRVMEVRPVLMALGCLLPLLAPLSLGLGVTALADQTML
jgi:hypothetical protein